MKQFVQLDARIAERTSAYTARTLGTGDELPGVAGGGVAGDLEVVAGPVAEKVRFRISISEALPCWWIAAVGYFNLPKAGVAGAEKAESAKAG